MAAKYFSHYAQKNHGHTRVPVIPDWMKTLSLKQTMVRKKGIPHFYVTLDDIIDLLADYDIDRIRHIDDCYFAGKKQNSKHYFITASLRAKGDKSMNIGYLREILSDFEEIHNPA